MNQDPRLVIDLAEHGFSGQDKETVDAIKNNARVAEKIFNMIVSETGNTADGAMAIHMALYGLLRMDHFGEALAEAANLVNEGDRKKYLIFEIVDQQH